MLGESNNRTGVLFNPHHILPRLETETAVIPAENQDGFSLGVKYADLKREGKGRKKKKAIANPLH